MSDVEQSTIDVVTTDLIGLSGSPDMVVNALREQLAPLSPEERKTLSESFLEFIPVVVLKRDLKLVDEHLGAFSAMCESFTVVLRKVEELGAQHAKLITLSDDDVIMSQSFLERLSVELAESAGELQTKQSPLRALIDSAVEDGPIAVTLRELVELKNLIEEGLNLDHIEAVNKQALAFDEEEVHVNRVLAQITSVEDNDDVFEDTIAALSEAVGVVHGESMTDAVGIITTLTDGLTTLRNAGYVADVLLQEETPNE